MTSEMCRIAVADGIRHIVATPHANDRYEYDRVRFGFLLERLQEPWGDALQFSLGCDFRFGYENTEEAIAHTQRYTIANSNYMLIELNDFGPVMAIRPGIFRLISNGLVPIVTHPERNPILLERREQVLDLVEWGCLIQVTASSFTGQWGERPQHMAEWLLKRDAIHVVASDAHDAQRRPPILSRAYRRVSDLAGKEVAQALFIDNPGQIVATESGRFEKGPSSQFPNLD